MSRYVAMAATIGVVGAGMALLEAALVPGLLIGGAAVLAPKYLPKLRRRKKPGLGSSARRRAKPAARPPRRQDVATPFAALPGFVIKRALAKTITYRVVITSLDLTWNYIVLGEAAAAAGLSAISFVVGPVFYFVHETAWHSFGPSAMRRVGLWRAAVDLPDQEANAPYAGRVRFAIDPTLAKTLTFRTLATTMEFATNYVVVRELGTAAALTAFGFVFGPFIYLGHEKAWEYFDAPGEGREEDQAPLNSRPDLRTPELIGAELRSLNT
jgi:uncharacterized membrane protein